MNRNNQHVPYFITFQFLSLLSSFVFISACSAQDDKLLHRDQILGISVYQSDLDSYIKTKGVTDTVGKTNAFIKIIASAKFLSGSSKNTIQLPGHTLTYEEGLIRAEENYRLRNMVDKVLVLKSERKMYLLKKGNTVKTFPIALGPNPLGQKEYEGDGKTPEGIYTLNWQKWNSSTFHSFHISYPNTADLERAKKKGLTAGSNIMVHGTSKGVKKRKDWTNGCIALSNDDMLEFRRIVFQDTEIEIRK